EPDGGVGARHRGCGFFWCRLRSGRCCVQFRQVWSRLDGLPGPADEHRPLGLHRLLRSSGREGVCACSPGGDSSQRGPATPEKGTLKGDGH
ncbi:unnamed protein product, partial [Ectocarpus sp. 8 AP-2014]